MIIDGDHLSPHLQILLPRQEEGDKDMYRTKIVEIENSAKFLITSLNVFFAISLFIGCSPKPIAEKSAVEHLQSLGAQFRVEFPTNYSSGRAASWVYSGRGGSDNKMVVIRLELDDQAYELWRTMATNTLKDYAWWISVSDPQLNDRFSWWDKDAHVMGPIVHYSSETNALPEYLAQLGIDVIRTNGIVLMYLESWTLTR